MSPMTFNTTPGYDYKSSCSLDCKASLSQPSVRMDLRCSARGGEEILLTSISHPGTDLGNGSSDSCGVQNEKAG